jgi:hypothetical protein
MVARIAIGEIEPETKKAVPKRRTGGVKGGKARAEALDPERRAEIARLAAEARWRKKG